MAFGGNSRDSGSEYSRRNYLKYGLVGLSASIAGCTGGDSGGGGNSSANDTGGNDTDGNDSDSSNSGSGGSAQNRWTVGTPGEGTSTFAIANGMSRILDEQGNDINLEVGSYSGSNEAIRLVGRGEDELAGAALPLASAAYNDTEPVPNGTVDFTGDNALQNKPVQSLNFLDFREYWVTLADSGIEKVSDFEGKNISVFDRGAAFNNLTLLSVIGMLDKVSVEYIPYNSIASALESGRVDATGIYAAQGRTTSGWQTQIINNDNVRMVTYNDEQIQAIKRSGYATPQPVYVGDIYNHELQSDEITGMAIPYGFFGRSDLPKEGMYGLTRTILDNYEQVQQFSSSVEHFTPEYAAKSLTTSIPVHSGVAQYFKQNDLWRDELSVA